MSGIWKAVLLDDQAEEPAGRAGSGLSRLGLRLIGRDEATITPSVRTVPRAA
jgi:hypothetical protein